MQACNGDGLCLKHGDGPNGYEINNCPHKCTLIECPNFIVCNTILPKHITYCHKGTCMTCAYTFGKSPEYNGKLTFYDSVECPICLEDKPGVKQINCDHTICIDCFKLCIYGYRSRAIPEPVFPYSADIEDDYENNHADPKWKNDKLIIKYNNEWKIYQIILDMQYESEQSLRICSLCRR